MLTVKGSRDTNPCSGEAVTKDYTDRAKNNPKAWHFKAFIRNKWLILLCACFVMAIILGFSLSFGVLFVDILEELNETRAITAAIQSVHAAVVLLSGFFVGFVVDRYDPRVCGSTACFVYAGALAICYFASSCTFLIVSWGVIAGVCKCFFLLSGMKTISRTFDGSTQAVALALLMTAPSIGGIPYPYLLHYYSDTYGLHWTFLISGGMMSVSGFLALTWVVPKQRLLMPKTTHDEVVTDCTSPNVCNNTEPSVLQEGVAEIENRSNDVSDVNNSACCETEKCDKHCKKHKDETTTDTATWTILKELFNNTPFILFAVGQALAHSSLRVLSVFVVDVLKERGLSPSESTIGLMVLNFCGIPGRLLPGLVKKVPRGSSFICVILVTALASPAIVGLNFASSITLAIMVCCLCGLALGAVHACNAIIIVRLVSKTLYTSGVGLTFGFTGVIVAVTGPLSGSIRDSSSSYLVTLAVISAAVFSGSVLFCLSFLVKKGKARKSSLRRNSRKKGNQTSIFTVSTRL